MAKPLALTSGEPAGIGPDIAIAAWLRRNELGLPPFYLLGDLGAVANRATILGLKVELADSSPEDALAGVPVTTQGSLHDALAQLTSELIVTTARIAVADLKARFGLSNPRLAVSGLNPHAGEDGSLGTEDIEIVAPAVEILRGEGIDFRGPPPADTMFHAPARGSYDFAICMYHDPALIPIQT